MSNLNQSPCALASPDRRLCDGLNLLVETKQNYFDPDSFRMSLNNTIQTLRNVTFVLQNTKSSFPTFDKWYLPWQELMKADNLMKWLITSRNIIAKQGDLETRSLTRINIVESWFDPPRFEMEVPPFTRTEDFARLLSERVPRGIPWDAGLLRVERRWIHDALPTHEILDSLVHSFDVLSELLFDAHNVLLDQQSRTQCPWFGTLETTAGRVSPCTLAQDWDRTVWLDLRDGAVMIPVTAPMTQSEEDLRETVGRYHGAENLKQKLTAASSLEERAAFWFEVAKDVLKTDGYHLPTTLLGNPDGRMTINQLHMEDRTAKHLILRKVAAEVERTGADSVILINEAWLSRRGTLPTFGYAVDDPNREEVLQLIAADAQGNVVAHNAVFVRDVENRIQFTEEVRTTTNIVANLLQPIMDVWERRRKKLEQKGPGYMRKGATNPRVQH